MENHEYYIKKAIEVAKKGVKTGKGGPFGALVVKDGQIISEASNMVTSLNDPTAHAEIMAIRKACEKLQSFQLTGCTIYSTCEPCPMCLGAIYWARPEKLIFACSKTDVAAIGFDDQFIYEELSFPISKRKIETYQIGREKALEVFSLWKNKTDRIDY